MKLRWVADDAATSLRERQFIDGGVVENLGLEGLRRFLRLSLAALPDVLIVSDASLYSAGAEYKRKVELLALLARSQNLSYEALHRQLYARSLLSKIGNPKIAYGSLFHSDPRGTTRAARHRRSV
jgi:hypothetical protein